MKVLVVEGNSGTMVYCKGCGAVAGVPSECLCWSSHEFVSTKVPVICKGCGAIPGNPTKCKAWSSHEFVPVPKARY
jgi:ribosomal protein S27E